MSGTSFTSGENPLRATKLNAAIGERIARTGDTMTGPLTLAGDPSTALGAATRQYVDNKTGSIVLPVDSGASSRNGRTGLLVPYYVTPTNPRLGTPAPIQRLLTMLRMYHNVPCIVVVNQAGNLGTGGPGPAADANLAAIILQLKALGAIVVGYVDTGFGANAESVIMADCAAWRTLYPAAPPDGVFFDQMAYNYGTADATLLMQQRLYTYCHNTLHYTMVVGNPGSDEQERWYQPPLTADVIACWENNSWPPESMWAPAFAGGHSDYDYRFNAVLVHSVPTLDVAAWRTTQKYVKWIYATDDLLSPNPWDTLSVHTEHLFALCNAGALLPQNIRSAPYTTTLDDVGRHIFHPSADVTARTWTIDSNANVPYALGTEIHFVNQNGAGVITIAITADTMRLAGAGTTGNRTLAANGVARALKIATTEWIINGTGLT